MLSSNDAQSLMSDHGLAKSFPEHASRRRGHWRLAVAKGAPPVARRLRSRPHSKLQQPQTRRNGVRDRREGGEARLRTSSRSY